MARGDALRAYHQRMIEENPNYYRELGKRNKGVKKSSYIVKEGSPTPAERGRLGGLAKAKKHANITKERQD